MTVNVRGALVPLNAYFFGVVALFVLIRAAVVVMRARGRGGGRATSVPFGRLSTCFSPSTDPSPTPRRTRRSTVSPRELMTSRTLSPASRIVPVPAPRVSVREPVPVPAPEPVPIPVLVPVLVRV